MTCRSLPLSVVTAVLLSACGDDPAGPEGDDDHWTQAESPILIEANTTIGAGHTLVIDPGVTVVFTGDYTLTIEGEIQVRGSEADPVRFIGQGAAGDRVRWRSVLLTAAAAPARYADVDDYRSGSIFEWCVFEDAYRALVLDGASPYVHHCTFANNVTEETLMEKEGGAAILIANGAAPRVRDCTFIANQASGFEWGGAIHVAKASPILQDNYFEGNTSVYGGALSTDSMLSPIVGNHFTGNQAYTEGGAIALFTSSPMLAANLVEQNIASGDGGGIHVCVDCFPHANPFLFDNTITANDTDLPSAASGSAGFGAAYLRAVVDNNVFDNRRRGVINEFGWYHPLAEGYPPWVANPVFSGNWWGTADAAAIANAIFDGSDDPAFGQVTLAPAVAGPLPGGMARVAITTRKIRYLDINDPMPLFLTLYNPGAARQVELVVALQYGSGAFVLSRVPLDFPGAAWSGGRYRLTLPENSVFCAELLAPLFPDGLAPEFGYWHAALFAADTGERVGETSSIRFQLSQGDDNAGPAAVPGVGLSAGGATVEVGQTRGELLAAWGAAPTIRQLGPPGELLIYEAQGVAALTAGSTDSDPVRALFSLAGYAGATANGIAHGGERATVETTLGGPGELDPFLGTTLYRQLGVGLEWDGDLVSRIHLF